MEQFVIAGKPVMVLSKVEVEKELAAAAVDRRDADFSNKALKFFSLAEKELEFGLNFKNALVTGNLFLAGTVIAGNIDLSGAVIDGSLFLNKARVRGNLTMEKTWVGQTANLAGANITGAVNARQARVNGFISFSKAVVLGDINLRQTEIHDYYQGDLKIKGDVFFNNAQINGSLDLTGILATGEIDLGNAMIRRDLAARDLKIENGISLKGAIFEKNRADFSGTPEEKIVR